MHRASAAVRIAFAFCSLAGFLLRKPPERLSWSSGAAVVSGLAFIYSMFAIIGAGAEVVFAGFLLMMAGLPVYAWTGRKSEV